MDLTSLTEVFTIIKGMIFDMVEIVGPLGIAVAGIVMVWVLAMTFFKKLINFWKMQAQN